MEISHVNKCPKEAAAIFQRLTGWNDHANAGQMVESEKILEIIVIAEISFLDPFCKNDCDTITHLIQQSKHDLYITCDIKPDCASKCKSVVQN